MMRSVRAESTLSWSATYGSVAIVTHHSGSAIREQSGSRQSSVKSTPPVVDSKRLTLKERITSPGFMRGLNFGLMCLALLGYGMGISLFAPFFPTEAEKRGVSAPVVGLIFASYTFLMFIGTPITGLLVNHLGLYFMIGAGIFLAGGATLLFGFLDQVQQTDAYIVLCFAARIIEGAGASMYMSAAYSMSGTLYPKQIAFVYALLEMSINVGRIIGPSVGGGLFNLGGFVLPFVVIGAVILIFGAISLIVIKLSSSALQSVEQASQANAGVKGSGQKQLSWIHFYKVSIFAWILSLVQALMSLLFAFPEPTLALYFAEIGLTDPALVGLVFLGGSLGYSLVCVFLGKVADWFPKFTYYIMGAGAIIVFVGMLLIGPAPFLQQWLPPSIGFTAAGNTLIDIGVAFMLSPMPQAMTAAIYAAGYPESLETNSMLASIYNGMWFGGACLGPAISGGLMDSVGFPTAGVIMAGISVFLLVLIVIAEVLNRWPCSSTKGRSYKYKAFLESTRTVSIPKYQMIT